MKRLTGHNIILSISLLTYSGFHLGRTYVEFCTLAHHLSLGSSMVRASHRSSESCWFVWGSEIVFLRIELNERSSITSRYLQALILLKYKSQNNYWIQFLHDRKNYHRLGLSDSPQPSASAGKANF